MEFEGLPESAAESLRALRRGLLRAEGFTLFVAVCNSPAVVRDLIRWTAESLPGVGIHSVALSKDTTDVLEETLRKIKEPPRSPVMILGLEKSNSGSRKRYPILQSLNLSRPQWPGKLACPVVIWVPEYLLGLLGREAPDFMDWRSDTLFFPDLRDHELLAFNSAVWLGGADGRMSEAQRLARIEELQSRLAARPGRDDKVVSAIRSEWLSELGNHWRFLGNLAQAEKAYRAGLEIDEKLQRKDLVARACGYLATVLVARGELPEAKVLVEHVLEIRDDWENGSMAALIYTSVGYLYYRFRDAPRAEDLLRKGLKAYKKTGDLGGAARATGNLGILFFNTGRTREAEKALQYSLRIFRETGHRRGEGLSRYYLAQIAWREGDLETAEENLRAALSIEKDLGARDDLANTLRDLGQLSLERGEIDEAERMFLEALDLSRSVGDKEAVAEALARLAVVYLLRGSGPDRVQVLKEAQKLFQEINMPERAQELEELTNPASPSLSISRVWNPLRIPGSGQGTG